MLVWCSLAKETGVLGSVGLGDGQKFRDIEVHLLRLHCCWFTFSLSQMLLDVLKGRDCILFTMLLVASTVGNTLVVLRRYLLAFFHSCTFVECIGIGQAAVPVRLQILQTSRDQP